MSGARIHIFKLPMEKIIEHGNRIESYTKEQAIMSGELAPISSSQLTGKIHDYYVENGMEWPGIHDAIVNIVVPSTDGSKAKKAAEAYSELARSGLDLKGRRYVRLCAGSGQLRNNVVTFIWDIMHLICDRGSLLRYQARRPGRKL